VSNNAKIGATDLGIDLSNGADGAVFQWLIACQLFGERISQEIAAKTFAELDKAGYTTPKKLADADWQALVDVLGRGGYRRYDESTARELISIGKYILEKYDGSMTRLRDDADGTKKEITNRIEEFKGVGLTAAKIFMREMWPVWSASN
jgi:endonuclease III